MNFCLSVLAIAIIVGMTALLVAWQRTLDQRFRDTIDTWAASQHMTIKKVRSVVPLMTLDSFVWGHPNDEVFKVVLHSASTGATVEGWLALGRDSVGAPNGAVTTSF